MCDIHNIHLEDMEDALQFLIDFYADTDWVITGERTGYGVVITVDYIKGHSEYFAPLYNLDEVYRFVEDGGLGNV